ncbi:hypothetical protein [Pseudoduganella sp. OTU4001]|uniref:hypothetical protein n=1 Tax=Pseudoduganella sp. OTU4001 TaxID=3043854 RepID=UPI00313E0AD4
MNVVAIEKSADGTEPLPATPSTKPAELEALHEIRDELRLLRAALQQTRTQEDAVKPDLAANIRTIAAVVGDRLFSVAELLAHAKIEQGRPLKAALSDLAGMSGKRVGKLLRGLEGKAIGGYRIERVGVDRQGAIWALRVCESETRKPAPVVE